ncbi:MAG TPA: hypothetical protein VKB87_21585 [Myxococcaceae bacterium]|nr:hypothetical protein [Myxococcaceae bacterium]
MLAYALLSLALALSDLAATAVKPPFTGAQRHVATPPAQPLSFNEFFEASPRELKPTQKLLGLNGKRVKMLGFMANLENAPSGAFYLAPRPVICDEAGGGTADLPPESVRVIVRSAQGKKIQFIPRLLEVTGILEVGNRVEDDGQVSAIRLVLDQTKGKRIPTKTK